MDLITENVQLMFGDCLTRLKEIETGSVDMILTDPPYGMGYQSNHRVNKHLPIINDKSLEWLDPFVKQCERVARNDTAHYFFCSHHHIDTFKSIIGKHFNIKDILVWEKNNTGMGDLKGCFAPKTEFIIFVHKGRRIINGKRDPNIFRFNRTGNNLHPTQKPVDLCEYLLSKFSDKGQTVLDPFMGSGSTGVAAAETGRRFIGIELDPVYFGTACGRILGCV